MKASVGDIIVVRGTRVGERERQGTITQLRRDDGSPPYVVRWSDGQESLFYPSADSIVKSSGAP